MTGVTLSPAALSQATASAQDLAEAVANTFGHNVEWFILVATVGLVLSVIWYLIRRMSRLGR